MKKRDNLLISFGSLNWLEYLWIACLFILFSFGAKYYQINYSVVLVLFCTTFLYYRLSIGRRSLLSTLWILIFSIYGFYIAYKTGFEEWGYVVRFIEIILFTAAAGMYMYKQADIITFLYIFSIATLLFAILLFLTSPISSWGVNNFKGITNMQRNLSAYIVGLAAVIFMWFYINNRRNTNLLFSIFCLFVMILTGSRKMIIGILIPIFLYIIVNIKTKKTIKRAIVITAVIVLIVCIVSSTTLFRNIYGYRLMRIFDYILDTKSTDGSVSARIKYLNAGWSAFKEKPIFGWGLGASGKLTSIYFNGKVTYFHNNFIELLVNTGIVGTIFYLFPIVKALFVSWKFRKDSLAFLMLSITSMFLILSIGQVTLYNYCYYPITISIVQFNFIYNVKMIKRTRIINTLNDKKE